MEKSSNIGEEKGENKSCWNCKYQSIGGNTFLGICTWFSQHGKQQDKEILPSRVDVGCKFFIKRQSIVHASNG